MSSSRTLAAPAHFVFALVLGFCSIFCTPAMAQQPTAAEMAFLQQLTPEQRAIALEQIRSRQPAGADAPLQTPGLKLDTSLGNNTERSDADNEEEDLRLVAGNTIALLLKLRPLSDPTVNSELSERLRDLIGRSVFKLNANGVLVIDDFYFLPLEGLLAEEAAIRIAAEPDFRLFDVEVTRLPLAPSGADALVYFGYDLFEDVPSTFAPVTDIPVPGTYTIGPGDTVNLQLFGEESADYVLTVRRDGTVNLPKIGPVTVAGLTFDEMRRSLVEQIEAQNIGVRANVNMGELRSINVFVLGDAVRPGSYTVSGLSTVTNALFASGGVREIGSLRKIQLKRDGKVAGRLDLYDLLLRGDMRADKRLQPGDVIFVPPVGKQVAVDGAVKRPAWYELNGEKTVGEAIALAGGVRADAFGPATRVERISARGSRLIVDIDPTTSGGSASRLMSGDIIKVGTVLDATSNAVRVSGHAQRPGASGWREGMRLSSVLPDMNALLPNTDLNYVLIRRESATDRRVTVLVANLADALVLPGSAADVLLMPRDQVILFDLGPDRSERVADLVEELRQQTGVDKPLQAVSISGRVRAEGMFPLADGMRIADLLRAGGGLEESAYTLDAELTRYGVAGDNEREALLIPIDLRGVLSGDAAANLLLRPHDRLMVREIPRWKEQSEVELVGEITFPGVYTIQRGETLSSVLTRAGGLTMLAFPEGSVFVREDLRVREQEQLKTLAARLQSDLVSLSLEAAQTDSNAADALRIGESLLGQLRGTEATGRLVINIDRMIGEKRDPNFDVILKAGDRLLVPKQSQSVTVLGEVQYSTSHIFEPGLLRDDYVNRSGGLTQKADKKRIYIVRANGSVVAQESSRWYGRSFKTPIRPGDTVVVPLDADRMNPLTLWSSVSQIVYQLALAAASANAIGVL